MTEEAGSKGETHPTRRRLLGGLAWTGGSQVVGQVVRMVVAVALARILAPEDYGLAAIALVFASLVLFFSATTVYGLVRSFLSSRLAQEELGIRIPHLIFDAGRLLLWIAMVFVVVVTVVVRTGRKTPLMGQGMPTLSHVSKSLLRGENRWKFDCLR